jgi:ribosomal protein L3 glutamine methyltransferase
MTDTNYEHEGLESITDFIRWGATMFQKNNLFFGHGTDNAVDEAKNLIFFVLKLSYQSPEYLFSSRLSLLEKQAIIELFRRRIESRKPAAYLTGEAWFAGLKFIVNENTLVPRSPIAQLIEDQYRPWVEPIEIKYILDMCAGSGCIGIASLQVCPNAQVDLVDLSSDALKVAQQNINKFGLEGVAKVIKSDLFSNLTGKKYNLIVSNPPYVDKIEMDALPEEFKQEPEMALEAGNDGLDLVRIILAEAAEYLTENGTLIVEVGESKYYLEQVYAELPLFWFEFENGGEGVFAIQKSELEVYQQLLDKNKYG